MLQLVAMKKLLAFLFLGAVSFVLVGAPVQAAEISAPQTILAKKHKKHHHKKHKKHKKTAPTS